MVGDCGVPARLQMVEEGGAGATERARSGWRRGRCRAGCGRGCGGAVGSVSVRRGWSFAGVRTPARLIGRRVSRRILGRAHSRAWAIRRRHQHFSRGFDADAHRLSFDLQDGDDDLIADLNLFASLARENQHETLLLSSPAAGRKDKLHPAVVVMQGLCQTSGNRSGPLEVERRPRLPRSLAKRASRDGVQIYKPPDSWFYKEKAQDAGAQKTEAAAHRWTSYSERRRLLA